jgi:uncharacterized protein
MVMMQVYRVGVDPQRRVPFVLLADADVRRLLPIYIGPFEANAIATQLQGEDFPRPLTHDLLRSVIEELGCQLTRVSITELDHGTFYALLHLEGGGAAHEVDARPSDAIALALRAGAPILVAEAVLAEAQVLAEELQEEAEQAAEIGRFRSLLGDLPGAETAEAEDLEE